MPETPENRNLGVLEYHTPVSRKWPSIIRWLINSGPWWIVPSRKSLLLLLPFATFIAALRLQPPAWKPGPTRTLTPIQWAGDCLTGLRPCPQKDAVFCVDGNGDPILWRPWDDRVLTRFHCPLPLTVAWLISSRDGSKLITELSNTELLLWDSSSGKLVHQLTLGTSPYLTTEVHDVDVAALSTDGTLLAVNTWWDKELTLWNISGAQPRKLASVPGSAYAGRLLFSPDDTLLVAGDDQNPHFYSVPTLIEVKPDAAQIRFASHRLAVSPDGRRAISGGGRARGYAVHHSERSGKGNRAGAPPLRHLVCNHGVFSI